MEAEAAKLNHSMLKARIQAPKDTVIVRIQGRSNIFKPKDSKDKPKQHYAIATEEPESAPDEPNRNSFEVGAGTDQALGLWRKFGLYDRLPPPRRPHLD